MISMISHMHTFTTAKLITALPDRGRCVSNSTLQNDTVDSILDFLPIEEACNQNCTHYEFEFDGDWTTETFASKFGLVCGDKNILYDLKSIGFVGLMVNTILGGVLSDKYGRRPVILGGATIVSSSALIIAIFNNHAFVYPIGWFLMTAGSFYIVIGLQYCMEIIHPDSRGFISMVAESCASGV